MKNFIFGTGYHGRQVYRKFNSLIKFKGFVDNNKLYKNNDKKLFKKKIYHSSEIKKTDFDKIYVGGIYNNQIKLQLINELKIDKKKIILLDRNKIKLNKYNQLLRETKLIDLLKKFSTCLENSKIKFWLINSSLLAIFRNENLSSFSDVDILIRSNESSKLVKNIKKYFKSYKIIKYKFSSKFYKKGQIKKVILLNKGNYNLYEPAILDIKFLYKKNKNFYQPIFKKNFLKYSFKHFKDHKILKYSGIKLSIPFYSKKILSDTYGKFWKDKNKSKKWQFNDYKNIL